MGASGTPLMYAFKEREKILDLFESLTGSRMMCNYMRFGGCRVDASAAWLDATRKVVAGLPKFADEFEALLTTNEILMARCQGIGVLRPELAVNAGVTGPMLRASGVNYDIRKVDHYGIYDRFNFRVPLGDHWDVYDRFMIRLLELRESIKILEQALKDIPGGPVMDAKAKIRGFRPKPGEAYGRIEAPKGELGFYLISDGGPNPYRYRVRPPSFINLDDSGRHVPGAKCSRCGSDFWQCGYCAGRSGSMKQLDYSGLGTKRLMGRRNKLSLLGEGILKGLAETAKNFAGSYVSKERLTTVQYPEERIPPAEAARVFPSWSTTAPTGRPACAAWPARSAKKSARPSASTSKRARTRSRITWASRSFIPRASTSISPSA